MVLASRLGGLPLATIIAGTFMRETGTNATEYLRYYQESWFELQLQSNPGRHYQQGNILQTWMISYYEIKKRHPDAAELLLLLAHFDNRDIWYDLVRNGSFHSGSPVWFKRATSNDLAFKFGVRTLIRFSLLEVKEQGGSYAMHPVVQDWCLHLATANTSMDSVQLKEIALIAIGHTVPRATDRNYLELQQRLIPHANSVRHWNLLGRNTMVWEAFHGLGILFRDQGKLEEAKEMYERALAGKEGALGADHTSTLDTVNNLGILYRHQGKLKEAEAMYQRALAGKERTLGADHTSTLDTVSNLGILYRYQGRLKEAGEMYYRALVGYEKRLGQDHISTLDTVNNLGLLYSAQGKLREAEEMLQRALTGYEIALGSDHTFTLGTINNLGNLCRDLGKFEDAEKLYQRALAGKENTLGPDHFSTQGIATNLGNLYRDLGKLSEAESMYRRAYIQ